MNEDIRKNEISEDALEKVSGGFNNVMPAPMSEEMIQQKRSAAEQD